MENFWDDALGVLAGSLDETIFAQWFNENCVPRVERRGSIAYICCSDQWVKTTLDQFFHSQIEQALFAACGCQMKLIFIDLAHEIMPEPEESLYQPIASPGLEVSFNPGYTFDSFVVGSSNRFAHAAAMAVAESPSKSYNPLFIYGGSGLGKTHLMHAIGQAVMKKDKFKRVVYVSTETFTSEFIRLLRENRLDSFKTRYRAADILLVDDIQFLIGKDQTQEEFFHTFNALHDAGKQIVISSDRPPKELNPLEDRLRNRFGWGLTTDIQVPDWETRCAILQRKAQANPLMLNDEVVYFIADKVKGNIRELEGALNKVMYYGQLNGLHTIDIVSAREALTGLVSMDDGPRITISLIQQVVADHYSVTVEEMKSARKDKRIAQPRQIAMYLCREKLGSTQPQIGRDFGNRDHTTVIHAINKITNQRSRESWLEDDLRSIEQKLARN